MTMLEKLRKEAPEMIGERYPGGVAICPEDIGCEKVRECPAILNNYRLGPDTCLKCWDREIPEDGE